MSSEPTIATPLLSAIEARILGCLAEKEAATPEAYPLTLNSLVSACNQKTSREPVMTLDHGDVEHALRHMEVRGLVRSQHTARAGRYAHRMEAVFDLARKQMVLLALLMLRGPQTLHELLGRSERWIRFEDVEDVRHALQRLAEREPPFAVKLPRGSGQREERYAHLMCGPPDYSAGDDAHSTSTSTSKETLIERIDALEARIAALESRLAGRA